MKFKKMIPTIMVISMAMSSTAFAGTWKTGAEENQNKWWHMHSLQRTETGKMCLL